MSLLTATNISHSFEYELFSDVNFNLNPKESKAILGRSGSGKSTLLHIFSTIYKTKLGGKDCLKTLPFSQKFREGNLNFNFKPFFPPPPFFFGGNFLKFFLGGQTGEKGKFFWGTGAKGEKLFFKRGKKGEYFFPGGKFFFGGGGNIFPNFF